MTPAPATAPAVPPVDAQPAHGIASWYGAAYHGKTMANGRPFDQHALTCASNDYPLGTRLRVRSATSGLSVVVTVTDRGPAMKYRAKGRILDLSRAAFAAIADTRQGLAVVTVGVAEN